MKQILLVLSSILLTMSAYAQDSLALKSFTMGGGNREFGYLGVKIAENRSVLFNITANCNTAQCDHGLAGIKIDNNGNMVYSKKIGSAYFDIDPNKAIYTSDKHILLLGTYESDKRMVVKMDTMFNVIWNKVIETREADGVYGPFGDGVIEQGGSYYILLANSFTKMKPGGDVVFSKYFGATDLNTDYGNYVNFTSITKLDNGRFFVTGDILDDGDTNYNEYGFLSVVDTNGTIVKQKKLDVQAPYGAGITHGFKESANKLRVFGHYHNDIYTAEIDTNLAVTNVKKYAGTVMYTHSICYNGSDRYFISAFEFNTQKISVFAIDNTGAVLWSKFLKNGAGYFRTNNYMLSDCAFAIYSSSTTNTQVRNLGFWAKVNENGVTGNSSVEMPLTITSSALTGTITQGNAVDSGQWQTTFDSETFLFDNTQITDSLWFKIANPIVCQTTNGVAIRESKSTELCSPNPFYGEMVIGREWELNKIEHLQVYDITGRVILNETYPVSRTIKLDAAKGTVFVRWTYEGQVYTQQMTGL